MSQRFHRTPMNVVTLPPVILKNSEAIKIGTPLTIDSSGFLAGATSSGEKIYGFSLEDYTASSDNQTVAMYKPLVADPMGVEIEVTSASIAQTDVGEYADVASNTAGVIVMANPGSTGQFLLAEIVDSTTGIYKVAEPQQFAFAQS